MRRAWWIAILGIVSFFTGAVGGRALGEDTEFPIWIFTWLGLGLIVIAIGMWLVGRRS
jgi:hypothetical protein